MRAGTVHGRVLIGAAVCCGMLWLTRPVAGRGGSPQTVGSGARATASHPDLHGVWANNTVTPFERPAQFAGRALLTDEELATLKTRARRLFGGDGDNASGDDLFMALLANPTQHRSGRIPTGEYNQFWADDGLVFERRTSQIVDPPDGRLPPYTPEGARTIGALAANRQAHPADDPEVRWPSERCLTFGTARVGFLQARNNSFYQIVQTADTVVLHSEMIHEARIVPITSAPHADPRLRFWSGDGRGHWDGNTLVIDTTNFTNDITLRLSPTLAVPAGHLHLVERLTRIGPDALEYRVTIDDPTTWTKPWTAVTTWTRSSERMFEYACHEANYSMADILRGARAEEHADERDN